jgi:hypothetical protein
VASGLLTIMAAAARTAGRPVTVYLTAQVAGVAIALAVGWLLLAADVTVWGAVGSWLLVSAYLSRKRLPSEAVGSALHLGAVVALLAPLTPYLPALLEGATLDPVAIASDLFGPVLLVVVVAGVAYAAGFLLKRRARRTLTRRARKGVYRGE